MKTAPHRAGWIIVWLVSALGLAPADWASAQGTITYFQPSEPLFNPATRGLVGIELDLNGDGQADCRFLDGSQDNYYFATDASGVGSARLLVAYRGPDDLGSDLVGLIEGVQIGDSLHPTLFWAAADAPRFYGIARVSSISIFDDVPVVEYPGGDFYGQTAFMGIHFPIGSDWHYGWVRIRGGRWGDELTLRPPAWILDWAYETRPGVPILAGAKPVIVPLASPEIIRSGNLRLRWQSEIGKAYQVQSKEILTAPLWTNLDFAVISTTTNAAVDIPITGVAKFFRVVEAD